MAFVFEVGEPGEVIPGDRGDWVIEFTLGFDAAADELVSMAVALIEDEDQPNPFTLTFGIVRKREDGTAIGEVAFDHTTARRYVARERANQVMVIILTCISHLCSAVKPGEIAFSTYEADLPPPAMQKYYKISNHLGSCGYVMGFYRREGTDLIDNWFFTKEEPE